MGDEMMAENNNLKARIHLLEQQADFGAEAYHDALSTVDCKVQRIAELEAVLHWYADPGNYGIGGGSSERIYSDAGKRARAALRKERE